VSSGCAKEGGAITHLTGASPGRGLEFPIICLKWRSIKQYTRPLSRNRRARFCRPFRFPVLIPRF